MLNLGLPLVLASSSPRRCDLLRSAGVPFRQNPAGVDERLEPGEEPREYVLRIARAKADRGRRGMPGRCLVLGCDTVVVEGGRILGKPRDRADARSMLRFLSGRAHTVLSGVALLLLPGESWAAGVSETQVTFRPLPDAEMEAYLDTEEYKDKAGAYALQGAAALFVERIEGSASNVIGLPLELLPGLIAELGLAYPGA